MGTIPNGSLFFNCPLRKQVGTPERTRCRPRKQSVGFVWRTFGGDEEDRTLDLTDANRTLSQLSYAPKLWNLFNFKLLICAGCQVVGARFADHLLSQLSYKPKYSHF